MLRKFTSRSAAVKVTTVIALVVSVAALSVAIAAWTGLTHVSGARPPDAAASPRRAGESPIESEMVTIRPWGFEPNRIERPAGRFFLSVVNRSGSGDADIRLDRVAGNSRQLVPLPKGNKGWRQEFDLPPGEYVLTETKHEGWNCTITLTNK